MTSTDHQSHREEHATSSTPEPHDTIQVPPLRLLFVCLGNICRSPAAEAIAQHHIRAHGWSHQITVDSAGLHGYHEGERADRRMRQAASARGYELSSLSRPITTEDYYQHDLIIGMDDANLQALYQRAPDPESSHKVRRMRDFGHSYPEYDHVPDPYYGGATGFELVLDLLEDSILDLLTQIERGEITTPD